MSDETIVVTGATGKVGSQVADFLLARREPVRVISRSAERLRAFAARGAEAFEGSLTDAGFLTRAFAGARAVLTVVPTDLSAPDIRVHQNQVAAAYAQAIRAAGVPYVVNLSSVGAEVPFGTGPIVGLHDAEERLDGLDGVNIVHLRPASFMENALANIPLIRLRGVNMGLLRGDVPFPLIAVRDIAAEADRQLAELGFEDKSTMELLGARDYTLEEETRILGAAIGKPGLRYVQLSEEEARQGLLGMGLTPHAAHVLIEMALAGNAGKLHPSEPRLPENTTPTTVEDWAPTFAAAYRAAGG
ncbi:MAG TPA: NAD(P)H-binding protein [Thermoanaerobaculia bacterium]|nr:NAD(P)H-binding protein [Thermoanaerobaculia bacterium]